MKNKLSRLEIGKEIDVECKSCQNLKIENEELKEEASKLNKFEKSTHFLKQMINAQKFFDNKTGLGYNLSEASTSGSKQVKFVKCQVVQPTGDSPQNMLDGPVNIKDPPAFKGPSTVDNSVTFPKSILGPAPKHLTVMNTKVAIARIREVKHFYKPLLKPGVGFNKPMIRSKTPPPRKINVSQIQVRPREPRKQNHPNMYLVAWNNNFLPLGFYSPLQHPSQMQQRQGQLWTHEILGTLYLSYYVILLDMRGIDLESDEWIKDIGCINHVTFGRNSKVILLAKVQSLITLLLSLTLSM